jgi:hypothetical protein
VPDWIELEGPQKTGQQGLAWRFTVRTERPGLFRTSVAFDCESGVGRCQISLEIKEGPPALGDLVFCDSPIDCHTSTESLSSLVRILQPLPFRVHYLDALADLGDLRPRTLILHQSGLLGCRPEEVELLRRVAADGTNLIVLADEFFRGTTAAANRVLAPFGLQMKQDGSDALGLTREEKVRRILNWQARYDRASFDSGPGEITPHPLSRGVQRLYWFRPCPVICETAAAVPLAKGRTSGDESFAAVTQPKGYVVAVGKSLWSGLSTVGWPYDNDRFLANLLVGGDAEQVVAGLASTP